MMMNGRRKYAVAIAVAGVMAVAAAGPSWAAQARKHKTQENASTAAPTAQANPASPTLPSYINSPSPCVLDDGYGRYQPCAGFN